MKKNKNIRLVALHFGYVEDASIPVTIYKCSQDGHTPFTALRSLASEFYRAYKAEYDSAFPGSCRQCCIQALSQPKPPKFCPECGHGLKKFAIDVETYIQYVKDGNLGTIDSWAASGFGYFEDESDEGWSPFTTFDDFYGVTKDEVFEIKEKAEDVLAMAIDPAIMTEDDRKAFESYGNFGRKDFYFGDMFEEGLKNEFTIEFEVRLPTKP